MKCKQYEESREMCCHINDQLQYEQIACATPIGNVPKGLSHRHFLNKQSFQVSNFVESG